MDSVCEILVSRARQLYSLSEHRLIVRSDMDLCCLIDSDERLAATDLVTMLGDLLERGAYHTFYYFYFWSDNISRNQVPRQTFATCANTNRETIS